ncbi:MAG: NAD(P)H-dependent oxidoreductase [Bacteroidales bacterium]|nr:NAD(P)H-dependent oxidoreductase [Bacteroidales bacterium]
MNIAVIYGSNRSNRQGIKVAYFILNQLKKRNFNATLIDTKQYKLPFLDKMYKEYPKGQAPEAMEKIHRILDKADGFVIVSGEYNHSIPAVLKNLLDHFQQEYYFKPSALVPYSAGSFGGMRVAVHLRVVLAELGMSSIPTIFPVSAVQDAFDESGKALNEHYNQRVVRFIDEFEWYLSAYKTQRANGVPY